MMRPFQWKSDGIVIGIAMLAPTLMTWLYFFVLAGQGTTTRVVYGASKVITGLLPLVWFLWLRYQSSRSDASYSSAADPTPRYLLSLKLGLDFGLFTIAGMLVMYYVWLCDLALLKTTSAIVQTKLTDAGVNSLYSFVFMAGFLSVIHSAFEEYYWRWFVFGRLRTAMPWIYAALISSVGFMLHHILVLYAFLPGSVGLLFVVLFSVAICVGGFIWCCIYQYTGSLLGAWIAHLAADVGIMWCGWDIVSR